MSNVTLMIIKNVHLHLSVITRYCLRLVVFDVEIVFH